MSHQRTPSTLDGQKEPHSVSLKVLRLSRPSLATQYPLPRPSFSTTDPIVPPEAALSYLSADPEDRFILSPLLTLPPSFGSAYVGETFSCTLCANNELPCANNEVLCANNELPCANNEVLCANNELPPSPSQRRLVNSVRITAEIQTPSQTLPLELSSSTTDDDTRMGANLEPAQSLQKIVRYDLKEEGSHVLAVTVTYSETALAVNEDGKAAPASGGRVRTFRKLYQFLAQQCLAVRTKAGELPPAKPSAEEKSKLLRYVLEAQLENMAEEAITLEKVILTPKPPFETRSLNWDVSTSTSTRSGSSSSPVVNPRDVMQIAFLIEQRRDAEAQNVEKALKDAARDGRAVLGQLSIEWRSGMGDRGFLSTGWLSSRKRA